MVYRRRAVRVVGAVSVSLLVATALLVLLGALPSSGFAVFAPVGVTFTLVGWLIAERRPDNWIGPLLLMFGLGTAAIIVTDSYVNLPGVLPGATLVALLASSLDAPLFILVALALVLFPDGTPPTPGWRWIFPFAILSGVGALIGIALFPGPIPLYPGRENPLGNNGLVGLILVGIGYGGLVLLLVAGAAALITRWRAGGPLQRAQIKWVGSAAVLLVASELFAVATYRPGDVLGPASLVQMVTVALVPISMGVAILRYRLYEIDRLISRGLSYAIIGLALSGLFVGAVLLLQAALSGITQGQSLAVASSTLLAFAVFQPLRRRVQDRIDRRFDRARYDAQVTLDSFAGRLSHEVDLDTLRGELVATTSHSVRPAGVGIWLNSSSGVR